MIPERSRFQREREMEMTPVRAKREPKKWVIVDGEAPVDEVAARIWEAVSCA